MAKAYSEDPRCKVFAAWQQGGQSQREVGARFGVRESFVSDLAALHRRTGDVAARPRGGGRRSRANPRGARRVGRTVGRAQRSHDCRASSAPAGRRFRPERGHGRADALAPAPATQKKPLKDDEASSERGKGLRAAWPERTAGIKPQDLVFLDESGVNRAMTWTYARRLCGTRAYGSAPRRWGDNVSILGALTLRGTLEPRWVNGATDGPVFLTFLKEVLVPRPWPGAVVVTDPLGAHKVRGVRGTHRSRRGAPALPAALLGRPQPYRAGLGPSSRASCAKSPRAPPRRWSAPSVKACLRLVHRMPSASSNTAAMPATQLSSALRLSRR